MKPCCAIEGNPTPLDLAAQLLIVRISVRRTISMALWVPSSSLAMVWSDGCELYPISSRKPQGPSGPEGGDDRRPVLFAHRIVAGFPLVSTPRTNRATLPLTARWRRGTRRRRSGSGWVSMAWPVRSISPHGHALGGAVQRASPQGPVRSRRTASSSSTCPAGNGKDHASSITTMLFASSRLGATWGFFPLMVASCRILMVWHSSYGKGRSIVSVTVSSVGITSGSVKRYSP